jgi:hypothetical protein
MRFRRKDVGSYRSQFFETGLFPAVGKCDRMFFPGLVLHDGLDRAAASAKSTDHSGFKAEFFPGFRILASRDDPGVVAWVLRRHHLRALRGSLRRVNECFKAE